MKIQYLSLLIIPILLVSWYWFHFRDYDSGNQGVRSTPSKLLFPYIESYGFYKNAALKAAAQGVGAEIYVKKILDKASANALGEDAASEIFREFITLMIAWSQEVDGNSRNIENISQASKKLDVEIEKIKRRCEALGWKFSE